MIKFYTLVVNNLIVIVFVVFYKKVLDIVTYFYGCDNSLFVWNEFEWFSATVYGA